MPRQDSTSRLDQFLEDDGLVALHLNQRLEPADLLEGGRPIVFPPTYADIGYNVDTLADGTQVALIDSVGSQANRLEPLLMAEDDADIANWHVPQIWIKLPPVACGVCASCLDAAGKKKKAKKTRSGAGHCERPINPKVSLLELAHRAADAVVMATRGLREEVSKAFVALSQGDAWPLATIAPTSLLFGVWDSRGPSQEKRPRLIRGVVRAWDVEVLHSAAQYNSVWKQLDEESRTQLEKAVEEAKKNKKTVKLSEIGFADAPSVFRPDKVKKYLEDGRPNPAARVLGGVLVHGDIERTLTINLIALRKIRVRGDAERTRILQRYLLALALHLASCEPDGYLREGALLRIAGDGGQWHKVPRRGGPIPETELLPRREAVEEALQEAVTPFRRAWEERWPAPDQRPPVYEFDIDLAKGLVYSAEDKTDESD